MTLNQKIKMDFFYNKKSKIYLWVNYLDELDFEEKQKIMQKVRKVQEIDTTVRNKIEQFNNNGIVSLDQVTKILTRGNNIINL